jgi:hypothetical protein
MNVIRFPVPVPATPEVAKHAVACIRRILAMGPDGYDKFLEQEMAEPTRLDQEWIDFVLREVNARAENRAAGKPAAWRPW